jgi:hypothetical protein
MRQIEGAGRIAGGIFFLLLCAAGFCGILAGNWFHLITFAAGGYFSWLCFKGW